MRHITRYLTCFFALLWLPPLAAVQTEEPTEISLDGTWEAGEDRQYDRKVAVPGLAQDPTKLPTATLWYRRSLTLPAGTWTRATLVLKGARFGPAVYVDGKEVSSSEGGMAPTVHVLRSAAVAPGRTVLLEIALKSLRELDPKDASSIPGADRWRTNVSSGLWDSVTLHFSGDTRIARMTPWTDFIKKTVDVRWELDASAAPSGARKVQAFMLDAAGRPLAKSAEVPATAATGGAFIELGNACQPWSPETPQLYRLRVVVSEAGKVHDIREMTWGLREFRTEGLRFSLNGNPVQLRAGTVVWHRFLRDPEAQTLGFDTAWFEKNILVRLQNLGANTVRFHLGVPPDALLDLCDRMGLMVQLEWSFFHGIGASQASMETQYRSWIEIAMRHPSVVLLHPWNETEGEQLKRGHAALAAITPDFPPIVLSHRDVIHIHKYWWSLFENLGLYYDSADEFPQPIMADEFGGNYLDGGANAGSYPTVRETYLRFLGRDHTRELRLRHHAESNGLVAEYWRRLGAAGFSPFCILGSREDGNHWFNGPLVNAEPKPVWAALSAAFAPESVSIAIWNRNFSPGEAVELPVHFFNERAEGRELNATISVLANDGSERVLSEQKISARVAARGTAAQTVSLRMPAEVGEWRIEAQLSAPVAGIPEPIKSTWRCRTLQVIAPNGLRGLALGVPSGEPELRGLLTKNRIRVVGTDDPAARALVFSAASWQELVKSAEFRAQLGAAVDRGQSVVLLDIGPRDLKRYQDEARSNLEGAPTGAKIPPEQHKLFSGIEVVFRMAAEPESHFHPATGNDGLWKTLPRESTWMWNGLRGGLVVPPSEMDVVGLSGAAFLTQWTSRGADAAKLSAGGDLFAYELAGYYAFSEKAKDDTTIAQLRARVKFLAEDAPSLQGRIDPNARVAVTDLAKALRETAAAGQASELIPLASAGKNLTRTPAVMVDLGAGRGRVVLSQLLTAGRLVSGERPLKLYELGHDPAAEQVVLNLIELACAKP